MSDFYRELGDRFGNTTHLRVVGAGEVTCGEVAAESALGRRLLQATRAPV